MENKTENKQAAASKPIKKGVLASLSDVKCTKSLKTNAQDLEVDIDLYFPDLKGSGSGVPMTNRTPSAKLSWVISHPLLFIKFYPSKAKDFTNATDEQIKYIVKTDHQKLKNIKK